MHLGIMGFVLITIIQGKKRQSEAVGRFEILRACYVSHKMSAMGKKSAHTKPAPWVASNKTQFS